MPPPNKHEKAMRDLIQKKWHGALRDPIKVKLQYECPYCKQWNTRRALDYLHREGRASYGLIDECAACGATVKGLIETYGERLMRKNPEILED